MNVPAPPVWLRFIMALLWPCVAALVTALCLPLALLGLLWWPVDRHVRLTRVTLLTAYAIWQDVGILVGCWVLRVLGPPRGSPEWFARHEALLATTLTRLMEAARLLVGFRIEMEAEIDFGDPSAPLLAFSRHAGPLDSIAMVWLLTARGGRVPRVVLTDRLLWDPGMNAIFNRLRGYFVPSHSGAGDDKISGVRTLAQALEARDVLLMFPEGGNWTPRRHFELVRRLRAKGDNERAEQARYWDRVLPPKHKGVVACIQARQDADVMVIAHTGLELIASPLDVWRSIPFANVMKVNTLTVPAYDLPGGDAAIGQWIDARWDEINEWVNEHERYGEDRGELWPGPLFRSHHPR